jgi:peptidyl-prolyl cis-trans isomerase SurA
MMAKHLLALAVVAVTGLALTGLGGPVLAQGGTFAPAFTVNGSIVTNFEYDQRRQFLTLLRAPGDIDQAARAALIEDRLRLDAAKQLGITITADQVKAGMEEFASRANLTAEQFVEALKQGGVEAETFRDFVSAGLIWREVVRAKFGGTVVIGQADLDRALSAEAGRGRGPRVLLSEIVLPAQQGGFGVVQADALELAETIRSSGDFAQAARERSAAPSRDAGGALGWMPLTNLPPQVRAALNGLGQGQVSEPVVIPGGVALFQLRGSDAGATDGPGLVTVDYLQVGLSSDDAARISAEARSCDEVYPQARKAGATVSRQSVEERSLPGNVAGTIAALDAGESAVLAAQGGGALLVMLCARTATVPEGGAPVLGDLGAAITDGTPRVVEGLGLSAGPVDDALRQELLNQRLNQLSDGYLAELVSGAIIVEGQ